MGLKIQSVLKICNNAGGVRSVHITPVSNLANDLSVVNPNLYYELKGARGNYQDSSSRSNQGPVIHRKADLYVPQKRDEMDENILNLLRTRCHLVIVDRNDSSHYILFAKLSYKYATGSSRSQGNGYSISFDRADRVFSHNVIGGGIPIPIGDDNGPSNSQTGSGADPGIWGGGSTPVDCTGVGVGITVVGDNLTALAYGGTGAVTYEWALDGVPISSGATITMGSAGSYTVVATYLDGCSGEAEHVKVDLCKLFAVSDVVLNNIITLTVTGADTPVYSWTFSADNTVYADLGNATNNHVCENTGYYKWHVIDANGCTMERIVYQSVVAAHTVSITKLGNVLSMEVVGCGGVLTYQWYLDNGGGKSLLPITASTLAVTENGTYYGVGICDGAEVEAIITVMDINTGTYDHQGQHQPFVAIGGQTELVVTEVDLPIHTTAASEVNKRYNLSIAGVLMLFIDVAPTLPTQCQLIAGNKIKVLALDVDDHLQLKRLKD